MAERGGFEASPDNLQVAANQLPTDDYKPDGTQNRTQAVDVACRSLARIVASWATLPWSAREAIFFEFPNYYPTESNSDRMRFRLSGLLASLAQIRT